MKRFRLNNERRAVTRSGGSWRLVTWRAPALLGLGMAAAWLTQQGWVTVVGVAGYLLILLADLLGAGRGLSRREAAGVGAGALAVVAATLITNFLQPLPFPVNFLVSLGLGAAMQFGTLNLIEPDPTTDLLEGQMTAEYGGLLTAMREVAAQTAAASQQRGLPPATSDRLRETAQVIEAIASRYQVRAVDFAGASTTVTLLQQFHKILAYYLKIKSGQQFLDTFARGREVAETEGRTIPMFHGALLNLGKQLDAGEVLDKGAAEDALKSMLEALNLITDLTNNQGPGATATDAAGPPPRSR
jgi:hypothetical protein